MKDFKVFKGLLSVSGGLSILLIGVACASIAGCQHKKTKPKPKPTPEIKWTPTTKAKSLIAETLKHYDKKHPFRYDWQKSWTKTWGDDFDSWKAKTLFISWFFPKIPNDKIEFQKTEDLCFIPHTLQKVYANYEFKTWGYTQIEFYLLSK